MVFNEGDIAGIVSARDLQRVSELYARAQPQEFSVNDFSSEKVVVADVHDPLEKILEAMWQQRLRAVIVLRDGDLAGIFTASDACKAFATHLRELREAADIPDEIA